MESKKFIPAESQEWEAWLPCMRIRTLSRPTSPVASEAVKLPSRPFKPGAEKDILA